MNKYGIILVIICGALLQGLLCLADSKNSPQKAAIEFTKAYYNMNFALLSERLAGDTDLANEYFDTVSTEALEQGFEIDYFRYGLFNIGADTISSNEDSAIIRITAQKKVAINPFYMFIGKIFNLGETLHVDEKINLVKEDGIWKVCGNL